MKFFLKLEKMVNGTLKRICAFCVLRFDLRFLLYISKFLLSLTQFENLNEDIISDKPHVRLYF